MDFPSTRKSLFYTTIILSPSKSVFDVLLSTSTRYKNPKFLNDRRNDNDNENRGKGKEKISNFSINGENEDVGSDGSSKERVIRRWADKKR